MQAEVSREWEQRQAAVKALLEELERLDDNGAEAEYEEAFGRLGAAGTELLEFEKSIPRRLSEPARLASGRLVKRAAWSHAAAAGVLALAIFPGWAGNWWGLAVGAMLVLAVVFGSQPITVSGLERQRAGAWLVFVLTLLPPAAVLVPWPGWLMFAWVVGWGLALSLAYTESLAAALEEKTTR